MARCMFIILALAFCGIARVMFSGQLVRGFNDGRIPRADQDNGIPCPATNVP
jgi:hypothetical protein